MMKIWGLLSMVDVADLCEFTGGCNMLQIAASILPLRAVITC